MTEQGEGPAASTPPSRCQGAPHGPDPVDPGVQGRSRPMTHVAQWGPGGESELPELGLETTPCWRAASVHPAGGLLRVEALCAIHGPGSILERSLFRPACHACREQSTDRGRAMAAVGQARRVTGGRSRAPAVRILLLPREPGEGGGRRPRTRPPPRPRPLRLLQLRSCRATSPSEPAADPPPGGLAWGQVALPLPQPWPGPSSSSPRPPRRPGLPCRSPRGSRPRTAGTPGRPVAPRRPPRGPPRALPDEEPRPPLLGRPAASPAARPWTPVPVPVQSPSRVGHLRRTPGPSGEPHPAARGALARPRRSPPRTHGEAADRSAPTRQGRRLSGRRLAREIPGRGNPTGRHPSAGAPSTPGHRPPHHRRGHGPRLATPVDPAS